MDNHFSAYVQKALSCVCSVGGSPTIPPPELYALTDELRGLAPRDQERVAVELIIVANRVAEEGPTVEPLVKQLTVLVAIVAATRQRPRQCDESQWVSRGTRTLGIG